MKMEAELEPLLRVLRRQVAVEERAREGHHLQSECASLVLTLPVESSAEEQRALRVALELLHTLWALDRSAWRHAMSELVGVEIPSRLVIPEDDAALTVVIGVKYDKFPWQLNPARWATLLDPHVQLTMEETSVKQALERRYAPPQTRDLIASVIPLRLQFLVFGMATSAVQTYVTRAVDMVEAVRDALRDGPPPTRDDLAANACTSFMLDSLELSLAPYEMTSGIARQVMRLHALGIRFHQLNLRIIQHETDDGEALEETADRDRLVLVLASPPRTDVWIEAEKPAFFVETLVLDRADLAQFSASCTALKTTRSIKNLQLQGVFTFDDATKRALKWEWLARAVLAPSSRTSIKHVSISQSEILLTDVDAVASALHAVSAETSAVGDHALETLAISCEASLSETLDAISLLVGLLGARLEALSVYLWMGTIQDGLVRSILRSCPNLLFLDLSSVELESMDVLLDAYDHGGCSVRSLALHNVEVPNESVTTFARALSDQRRPAARVLRELCIDSVGINNALDQRNLDAFLALLDAPRSPLEYLEQRVAEPLLTLNRSRFVSHHNTWGSGVAAPLSIASRTAFLAVCKPRFHGRTEADDDQVARAQTRLDQHLVSLIFQFAATRSWRSVHFAEA